MTSLSKTAKPSGAKVVFFGSGPVAAESLRLLAESFDIEAIITKPATTGEMAASVKDARIYTVENRHELDALMSEATFESSVGVLIDFGIIVSQRVIDHFPRGIVNSHFSLLPEWRGADPITFSILSGQKKTGVSLMLLTAGMDEGPLIGFGEQALAEDLTTPELTEKLILLSDALLKHDLPRFMEEGSKHISQAKAAELTGRSQTMTYSRKLFKEDGRIDWRKPASVIEREIRAFSGWPKSSTKLGDIELVITKAHRSTASGRAGRVFISGKELGVFCGKGALIIDELKPAGKKEMPVQAFLAGYKHRLES